MVRHVLERLGLGLNESKTHIVDATQASFNFLGFTLQMSRGASTGKPTGRQIAEEDQGEADGTDRHPLGKHCGKCEPQPERLGELFPLSELKSGDEQGQKPCGSPVANSLDERHKVKDRKAALCRFPRRDLYERYGLHKIPTVAGWRSTHALA